MKNHEVAVLDDLVAGDDTSTSRDTAFAKIQARITGTAMASSALGV